MPVIVILEIFENVADVEEGIAIEADIDESGLHAGEDASDFAFVDAADEGELFFRARCKFRLTDLLQESRPAVRGRPRR